MNVGDVATVIEVACSIEDRAAGEQRALLAVALAVDTTRARFTLSNPEPVAPYLVDLVLSTQRGRVVPLTNPQARRYERLRANWRLCDRCGRALGRHYGGGRCP